MQSFLLERKRTHFVLWMPGVTEPPPRLVLGRMEGRNPPRFVEDSNVELRPSPVSADIWEISCDELNLADGQVYHYWFEVTDSNPEKTSHPRIRCTDPTAWTVDWRALAPRLAPPFYEDDRDPAGVVKFEDGRLVVCDPGGEMPDLDEEPDLQRLPANHRMVIYELPTRWTSLESIEELENQPQLGVGSFRDVRALVDPDYEGVNFRGTEVLAEGRSYLEELGINALELLPPADSFVDREWGYATSNYFAADFDLGFPEGHCSPTATVDLTDLIRACHERGIRFFTDIVMAFATRYSYENINYLTFHVQKGTGDPEEFDQGEPRQDFGGRLFKLNFTTSLLDPVTGQTGAHVPARRLLLTHLIRWMQDFRINGIRLDSVKNYGSWDFIGEFKDAARAIWADRWNAAAESEARFLVVGEELAVPVELVVQNRLDSLWNEEFKRMLRAAILGRNDDKEPSFEWTVRKMIDCRLLGFRHTHESVNYVTSHDVGGFRNERLFNFLENSGIAGDAAKERRIRLAFVCLMTAVGIPMIFAGEEFADEHDLPPVHPLKQVDPVNFDRLDGWRNDLFAYVSRLVKFRIQSEALSGPDTEFIHVDFNDEKRVLAWRRGTPSSGGFAVVVANFSDFQTPRPFDANSEYVVPNWPSTPTGMRWREVTQERDVPAEWAGREPIFPWEAKVYTLIA